MGLLRRTLVFAFLALAGTLPVAAATQSVSPTHLTFREVRQSADITVFNDSLDTIRYSVTAYAWSQTAAEDYHLAATADIVYFPGSFILGPGERRRVRVGSLAVPAETEKTYRIVVSELPSLDSVLGRHDTGFLHLNTRFSIPIYVAPATARVAGRIENLTSRRGKLSFSLANTGNAHIAARAMTVRGLDADGQTAFTVTRSGWFVLPGSARRFDFDIPPVACARTTAIAMELETLDNVTVRERQPAICR